MIDEVRELYQAMILDHGKRPRNFRRLPGRPSGEGHNPLCGDRVTVFAEVGEGVLRDLCFEGNGCAICTASASMMTERLKGRPIGEAYEVFDRFHDLVVTGAADTYGASLGKLSVFRGVSGFPARIKCATLPWHAMLAALRAQRAEVPTGGGRNGSTTQESGEARGS